MATKCVICGKKVRIGYRITSDGPSWHYTLVTCQGKKCKAEARQTVANRDATTR